MRMSNRLSGITLSRSLETTLNLVTKPPDGFHMIIKVKTDRHELPIWLFRVALSSSNLLSQARLPFLEVNGGFIKIVLSL